jgi:hypothetical protein
MGKALKPYTMETAGYSATSLAKKLGLKQGFIIKLVKPPDYYFELFSDMPEEIDIEQDGKTVKDFIHFFTKDALELGKGLKALKPELKQNGMLWVSWPKKSSHVYTDITEDLVRDKALKNGLVDIKVCAVDDTWSALKLVIPAKDRVS